MKSKHTSWRIVTPIAEGGLFKIYAPEDEIVAECWAEEEARLIAAAPELLETAKRVIEFKRLLWNEDLGSEDFYDWLSPSFQKLVDAITKAE